MNPNFQKVLEKFAGIFPVPVVDIAIELGYTVQLFTPIEEYCNVMAAVHFVEKQILINQNDTPENTPEKKRFALAHQIGHIYNDQFNEQEDSQIDSMMDIDYPNNEKEIKANAFAINLLMPEEAFKKEWEKFIYVLKNDIETTAQTLRMTFGVSVSRILERVAELKLTV